MIIYQESPAGITPDQLHGFFVGWAAPLSPEDHLKVLRNSAFAILAIEDETDRVVGFITAISDGVLSAYIPLLEVLPSYQGQGIGAELLQRMLWRLRSFQMVDLMCDAPLQEYYSRFGMRKGLGMMIRRHNLHPSKMPDDWED